LSAFSTAFTQDEQVMPCTDSVTGSNNWLIVAPTPGDSNR